MSVSAVVEPSQTLVVEHDVHQETPIKGKMAWMGK
jgi:hypothetical protein